MTGTAIWSAVEAAARRGPRPDVVVLSVPATWEPPRARELLAASAAAGVAAPHGVHAVPAPVAVAELVLRTGSVADGDRLLVCDAGAGEVRVTAVDASWSGSRPLGAAVLAVPATIPGSPDDPDPAPDAAAVITAAARSTQVVLQALPESAPVVVVLVGGMAGIPGLRTELAAQAHVEVLVPDDPVEAAAVGAAWLGARLAGLAPVGADRTLEIGLGSVDHSAEAAGRVPERVAALAAMTATTGPLPSVGPGDPPVATGRPVASDEGVPAAVVPQPRDGRSRRLGPGLAVAAVSCLTLVAGGVAAVSLGGSPVAGAPPSCPAAEDPPPWVCIEDAELTGDLLSLTVVARGAGSVGAEVVVFGADTAYPDDPGEAAIPLGRLQGENVVTVDLADDGVPSAGRRAVRSGDRLCAQAAGVPLPHCVRLIRTSGPTAGPSPTPSAPAEPSGGVTSTTPGAGVVVVPVPSASSSPDRSTRRSAPPVPDRDPPAPGGGLPAPPGPAPPPPPPPTSASPTPSVTPTTRTPTTTPTPPTSPSPSDEPTTTASASVSPSVGPTT
ncbi:MAG: hypothetical protein ACFCVF_02210 [Kineosporiaceae bacterium]